MRSLELTNYDFSQTTFAFLCYGMQTVWLSMVFGPRMRWLFSKNYLRLGAAVLFYDLHD